MATVIRWSDELSVEIKEIDEQHKRIVDLINALYTAIAFRQEGVVVDRVLDELVEYTRVHFAVEESLLRLFNYPGYAEHKAIHDRIVERVLYFQQKFRSGDRRVGMELLYFLKDWLADHISTVDKQYSGHLARRGTTGVWQRAFGRA